MKHSAITALAFMASTTPGMAYNPWADFNDNLIPALAIIMTFGLPVFVIGLTLYFNYKNKKAKYDLASQAIAVGKDIPNELFKSSTPMAQHHDMLTKGIKKIFLGFGLGVFLWVLTYEEAIAAIGFLIFCIGAGQVVIAYVTRPKDTDIHTITNHTEIESR